MAIWPNFTTFRHHFSTSGIIDPLTGHEEWPLASVRANGFTTFTVPRPITVPSFKVTVNGEANDGVAHVDEYNWWVSLRNADPANQHISVTQVSNKSGTLQFDITARASELIPGIDALDVLDEARLHLLYRNVWIYVQRISDDAVQGVELLTASISDL